MHISDKLGQYSRNLTNGTEELRNAQGAQKMVSTVRELSAGSVFEGTVNYAKNGKVVLGLGNGQTITARLDGKVDIKQGSSMFFQVKSNDGTTVAIKPYTGAANAGNPTLLNALTAAQVPVTERSLMMVDAMMQEHLSIGKQSILDMVKILNQNPGANVHTLVTMTKLGMPVTEELAAQFEHYISGKQAILQDIESVAYQMLQALGDEAMEPEARFSLYGKMIDGLILGGEVGQANVPKQGIFGKENLINITAENGELQTGLFGKETTADAARAGLFGKETTADAAAETEGFRAGLFGKETTADAAAGTEGFRAGLFGKETTADAAAGTEGFRAGLFGKETAADAAAGTEGFRAGLFGKETTADAAAVNAGQIQADGLAAVDTAGTTDLTPSRIAQILAKGETLGQIFSEEQMANLTKQLQNMPTLTGNTEIFLQPEVEDIFVDTMEGDGVVLEADALEESAAKPAAEPALNKDMTAREFLYALKNALQENEQYGFSGMRRLFSGKEFRTLLKQVIHDEWLLEPKDLKEESKVQELYGKMERQLMQIESAVKATGGTQDLLQTAANIRGNIEFMNQMNQIYTYVQMPLKLSKQNANGELYVYTNKKQLKDPDAELTAFLHLDLQNLGSTDVSVKLYHKKVSTKFYFSDDASYRLVEKHLPILEKHLQKKGYQCTITASNEKHAENTMEEFLKQGQPQTMGLHRYSFDVRT